MEAKQREQLLIQLSETYNLPCVFEDSYVRNEIDVYAAPYGYKRNGVSIVQQEVFGRCDDYLNKNFRDVALTVPRLSINSATWMSLTPMEVQSAALAIALASGKVATCGLGLGYYTLSVARKDDVESVDVYEINNDVIEYFVNNFSDREGYEKINIIAGDARELLTDKTYDFVYNDIYLGMLEDAVIDDITLFTSNNIITNYWFWGLELVILAGINAQLIGTYDIPDVMKLYFIEWSRNDRARMGLPTHVDEEYIVDVVNTLSQSGASEYIDIILE